VHRRVLLALVVLTACASPEEADPDAIETMVLATCAPRADPVETEVCECAFDAIRARFDADDLERLDRQLRDDPDTVPAEVQEAVLDCGFDRVSPPTTKPATTTTGSSVTASTSTSTTLRRP
jgi:hypothetical protein